MMQETTRRSAAQEWKYAERAMTWYGWGSPVGAGIFLVCLAVACLLVHLAIVGL